MYVLHTCLPLFGGHMPSEVPRGAAACAIRGETPGTASAASDAPSTRTARRRGIGSASVRATWSKKSSVLT